MKMISSILLLLILSSCLCAATFVVNVTQSSYQAEEKQNITLEWTFTTKTNSSPLSLFIDCKLRQNQTDFVIYHINMGVEASLYLDKRFAGRVQSDKDVLKEGRIRLHVSRLRTEDSGLYQCDVMTDYGFNSGKCRLSVSAADQIQTQRPTLTPEPERRGRIFVIIIFIIITLGLTAALMFLLSYFVEKCFLPVYVNFNNETERRDRSGTLSLETI